MGDEQKRDRVRLCRENLTKFRDGFWRLCDIIAGDEIWVYHQQMGHKSINTSWLTEGESPTTVAHQSRFQLKTLFSTFFRLNDPILIHAVDKDKTVNHNYYIENCLKPVVKEIRKQRQSSGAKGIKLLQDNARSRTHSDVIHYLTKEGIIIVSYPPYSPSLERCDYWLNDDIKRDLTDQLNEKSAARTVSKVVKNIPEEFRKNFRQIIRKNETLYQ